jgi:hypothetical protein
MNFDPSWSVLFIGLLVIAGLLFLFKSFKLPPTYHKNKEQREEVKKKLEDTPLEP